MTGTARKAVAEAIGTFLFVFSIIGAINSGSPLTALVIGIALMVLVYATGHISGGHLNPAVSFGVFLRGGLSVVDLVVYIIAQIVGGVLAALASFAFWPAGKPMEVDLGAAFLAEALFTLVLVYTVLNTATAKGTEGNSFYGFAIGMAVFVGAVTVGGISGGSFNPAVAFGLSVSGQFDWAALWMYILAPLVGAAIAAVLFRVLNTDDAKKIGA